MACGSICLFADLHPIGYHRVLLGKSFWVSKYKYLEVCAELGGMISFGVNLWWQFGRYEDHPGVSCQIKFFLLTLELGCRDSRHSVDRFWKTGE